MAGRILQPKTVKELDDPFEQLTHDQIRSLNLIARYREILEEKGELYKANQEEYEAETAKLIEWGVDIEHYLEMRQKVIEQRIKIGICRKSGD